LKSTRSLSSARERFDKVSDIFDHDWIAVQKKGLNIGPNQRSHADNLEGYLWGHDLHIV